MTMPPPPSWTRTAAHFERMADDELASIRSTRTKRLAEYAQGRGIIGLHLQLAEADALRLLVGRGPDVVREELRPLVPYARREAEQMFRDYFRPDGPITGDAVASATGVCMYECLGLDAGDVLSIFKPYLVRIETSRRDEYVFQHWNRALAALALDDRRTWGPIAGFMPKDPIEFTPRTVFEFNVQGFIAHLAGAIVHQRAFDDVLPAWRDFVRVYPYLQRTKMANLSTLLWSARLVHHHIGRKPLSTVAEFLYTEIQAAIAAERTA